MVVLVREFYELIQVRGLFKEGDDDGILMVVLVKNQAVRPVFQSMVDHDEHDQQEAKDTHIHPSSLFQLYMSERMSAM